MKAFTVLESSAMGKHPFLANSNFKISLADWLKLVERPLASMFLRATINAFWAVARVRVV